MYQAITNPNPNVIPRCYGDWLSFMQASVRRCVTVTASIGPVGASVTPAGKVRSAMCHTHSVRTRCVAATANVSTARVCVRPGSEDLTASMVTN